MSIDLAVDERGSAKNVKRVAHVSDAGGAGPFERLRAKHMQVETRVDERLLVLSGEQLRARQEASRGIMG